MESRFIGARQDRRVPKNDHWINLDFVVCAEDMGDCVRLRLSADYCDRIVFTNHDEFLAAVYGPEWGRWYDR